MTYTVTSGDSSIASVSESSGTITITPEAKGTTSVDVEASDGTDSVTETFNVTIDNASPTVANGISDITANTGDGDQTVDLETDGSEVFTDADGDSLTYNTSITSDDNSILNSVTETGGTITLEPEGTNTGTATISVEASDGEDNVTETFDLTLE